MRLPPDADPRLAALVRALREADPDIAAEEIADALFLAGHLRYAETPSADTGRRPPTGTPGSAGPSAPEATPAPGEQTDADATSRDASTTPATDRRTEEKPSDSAAEGEAGALFADVEARAAEAA